MVSENSKFNVFGYAEVQIATVLAGLRWSLTQILLKRASLGIGNPMATIFILAPFVAISLFVCFLIMESSYIHVILEVTNVLALIVSIICSGILAFVMMFMEYTLVTRTSVLTLSIAGIVKEILTIFVGQIIFRDSWNNMMTVGLVISLVGIVEYNRIRSSEPSDEEEISAMYPTVLEDGYVEMEMESFEDFNLREISDDKSEVI